MRRSTVNSVAAYLLLVVLPLLLGGMAYLLSPRCAQLWEWISRGTRQQCPWALEWVPRTVADVLPDACWAFAMAALLTSLWAKELRRWQWAVALGILAGVSFELAQLAGWVPGYFDGMDLGVSLIGGALGGLSGFIWVNRRTHNEQTY